jgi:dienelactone hydrolase
LRIAELKLEEKKPWSQLRAFNPHSAFRNPEGVRLSFNPQSEFRNPEPETIMLPRCSLLLAGVLLTLPVRAADPPPKLAPSFKPPKELAGEFGDYRSPLKFDDGTEVKTADDWKKRCTEIRRYWTGAMGEWPALIEKPKVELGAKEDRDGVAQHKIKIETAPGRTVDDAYLLVPAGRGPFPAVVVVFYEANTPIGKGKSQVTDFALQLAKRGFVALALGGDPNTYYPTKARCRIQPLSFHAYEAANCCTALAQLPNVDPKRIGVLGHSYGGKWALFALALHDGFACGAVSDPGIVFDEKRSNVNYWEPWYLGFDPELKEQRKAGIPNENNPRTGPYRKFVADGRDLTDLHALIAPRPFFVSGGSEDPPVRWQALNHLVAVNKVLGAGDRVAMTNRKGHAPTAESNELLYLFFESALK